MTEWISTGTVRHIPEDELHAYLDQALSRSQCVEIECHIAECHACEQLRSRVAAVRDRTTALLADAGPGRVRVPPYEELLARRAAIGQKQAARRQRIMTGGLMAAGLSLAVGAGWVTRGLLSPAAAAPQVASAPARSVVAVEARAPIEAAPTPARPLSARTEIPTERSLVRVDRSTLNDGMVQVNAVAPDEESPSFDGLWQTVDAQRAAAETGGNLPRIEGLPILEIQLQRGSGEERPTVVVYQQHPSGKIIRTIEGPMERVEELVARHSAQSLALHASQPELTPPDYLSDGGASARRVLRIVTVTGLLPADSLNALAKTIAFKD